MRNKKDCVALTSMENKEQTIEVRRGRKPGKDNKVPLTVYVEESVVTRIGNGFLISGKDKAREVALAAIYDFDKKGSPAGSVI